MIRWPQHPESRNLHDYLFVYGTLLSGLAPPALAHLMSRMTFLGPASVPGRLFDFGLYPGAIPDAEADQIIHGELYSVPTDIGALNMLDHYEGYFYDRPVSSLFRRTQVSVTRADGRSVIAWMYAWNRPIDAGKLVANGDYRAVRAQQRTTG